MDVVEHRTPLPRIEIGQRVNVDKRRDITEAVSGISPVERDRIWRLIEQTARGINPPADHDAIEEMVKNYLGGE